MAYLTREHCQTISLQVSLLSSIYYNTPLSNYFPARFFIAILFYYVKPLPNYLVPSHHTLIQDRRERSLLVPSHHTLIQDRRERSLLVPSHHTLIQDRRERSLLVPSNHTLIQDRRRRSLLDPLTTPSYKTEEKDRY